MDTDGLRDERVMIFIDLANTERRVRKFNLWNLRLDYEEFRELLTMDRRLVKSIVYDSCTGESDYRWAFFECLEKMGFQLVVRDYLHSDKEQKEVDVAMAMGMLTEAYRDSFDTAIVVSGDRDFLPALEALKDMGKRVEVASFMDNASNAVIEYADRFINMDKLCILDPSRCEVPVTSDDKNTDGQDDILKSGAEREATGAMAHGEI